MRRLFLPFLFLLVSSYAYSSDIVWLNEGYYSIPYATSISDNQRYLGVSYYGNHNTYKVWDLQTNTSFFEKSDSVDGWQAFSLSHDAKLLSYYHNKSSHLKVINITTNTTVYEDTLMVVPAEAKFTSDNKSIIMHGHRGYGFNGYVKLDLVTGKKTYYSVPRPDSSFEPDRVFKLSDNDKYLLTAIHNHNQTNGDTTLIEQVILLNLQNGEVKRLLGHRTTITAFTFTPDSRKAITISDPFLSWDFNIENFKGSIITWDVETGEIISNVPASNDTPYWTNDVNDLIFNREGSMLIQYAGYRYVMYFEYPSMNIVRSVDLHESRNGIHLTENNDLIFYTMSKFRKYIYQTDTIIELSNLRIYNGNMHTNSITKTVVSPDDKIVATSSMDNLIKLWDGENGSFMTDLAYDSSPVMDIDFSPDGNKLASVSSLPDKKLVVWNINTQQPLYEADIFNSTLHAVAFSPMGAKIAVVGLDDSVLIFNASTGEKLISWYAGLWISDVAFSPDGRYLVTSMESGGVKIWDAETGELIVAKSLEGQGMDDVKSVSFSNDGSLLALACFEGYVRVVETQGWTDVCTFDSNTEHNDVHISKAPIKAVCFSPDKKYLYAILTGYNLIKAWDLTNGSVAHIYDELYFDYSAGSMTSISTSHDSKYIYTTTELGMLIKWKNPTFLDVPVKKQELFQVFPNPANNYIRIRGDDTIERLQIYDISGKLVFEILYPNPENISLEGISSGTYYLKIKANNKTEEYNMNIVR